MVKLRIAEALKGKQLIFMPTGRGGTTLQTVDMNQILSQYAVSKGNTSQASSSRSE